MGKYESVSEVDLSTVYEDVAALIPSGRMPYIRAQQSLMEFNAARMVSTDPLNRSANIICKAVCELKETIDTEVHIEPPLSPATRVMIVKLTETLLMDPFYLSRSWQESSKVLDYARLTDAAELLIHSVVDHGGKHEQEYFGPEILA